MKKLRLVTFVFEDTTRFFIMELCAIGCLLFLTSSPLPAQPTAFEWPPIQQETKPWTRWWWPASAVDSNNITWNLEQIAEAGFGGVEITPIYGAKGQEHRFIPYLSDRWVNMFGWTVAECGRLGLGVDMPPGTGWRTGGPWVTLTDADSRLNIDMVLPVPRKRWKYSVKGKRVLAIIAYGESGPIDLTERIRRDSSLVWTPPVGTESIYIASLQFQGGNVKRPAPGGEGRAVTPYSRAALQRFLDEFARRSAGFPRDALRSYFHDSFEYVGDACPEIFARFEAVKGYDVRWHLPALHGQGNPEEVLGVQADYREVLGLMVLEDFSFTLRNWSHEQGSLFKNQAHGSPGNLLDLYAAADIPETEIFGPLAGRDADRLINKFASSAAHVMGKPLTSAEGCTWLGEHFTVGLDSMKAAMDHLLLAGVNHVAFHGTIYSPQDIPWPGWLFYASIQMNPQNPLWVDVPTLLSYLSHCQSILQSGKPDNDILLYWPYQDAIHGEAPLKQQLAVHDPDWFYDAPVSSTAMTLQSQGYTFDYISDQQLGELKVENGNLIAQGGDYKMIVIPECTYLPIATAQNLVELARAGVKVVLENQRAPSAPGWLDKEVRSNNLRKIWAELQQERTVDKVVDVGEALVTGIRRESLTDIDGLEFIRRKTDDGTDYFLVNQGNQAYEGWIPLAVDAESIILMDPLTGTSGKGSIQKDQGVTQVFVQIPVQASLILRTLDHNAAGSDWLYVLTDSSIPLRGDWKVEFVSGGPELPQAFETEKLSSWTDQGKQAAAFSGTVKYSMHFDDSGLARQYQLQLGQVDRTARIYLNGQHVGTSVMAPHNFLLSELKPSGNLLEVHVTNLAANRIRDLDRRDVLWKNFYDINFVNVDYEKFDASNWPVYPAGLMGPVTLHPVADKVFAFSYFMGNGEDGLHLALSTDGKKWNPVNQGKSLLKPEVGESVLMRDPCITRGPDGAFHMVWTTSWTGHTIGYARSPDLIHWSEQKAIPVMVHEPTTQNCWAPEIIYDEDNEEFLIFWSTTIPGRFPETDSSAHSGRNHRMYATTTRDFENFTPTRLFYDQGFNVIDGSIIVENGRYGMFLKDESLFPQAQKNIRLAWSDQMAGPYTEPSEPITGDYWAEGPTAVKIQGRWHLYFDKYVKHSYGLLTSADLIQWTDESAELQMPEGIRHGTIFEITPAEAAILSTYQGPEN